ncbi:MAG: D-alanine--D-alanine ligase [Candidatus Sericytochromatia bacterium]
MPKLRVAVIQGGPSPEREVSLRSAQMVLKNLDPAKYEAFAVDLSDLLGDSEALAGLKARADFAFLAVHGAPGEDGTVQGMLDLLGIPYQGSGVMASALAMNKIRSKAVYRDLGLPQARGMDFHAVGDGLWRCGLSPLFGAERPVLTTEQVAELVGQTLGWSLVLKGASQGSTLGLSVVSTREAFAPAMAQVLAYDPEVLIEERLSGLEVTAGVMGGREVTGLPLVEIRPKGGDLFDYEAKYAVGGSEEICPARLDEAITQRIQALAIKAHHGLGCWGYSRSDFIIDGGEAYILETNTLPGLTEASLLPKAVRATGVMLPDMLDQLILWGLERAMGKPSASGAPSAR